MKSVLVELTSAELIAAENRSHKNLRAYGGELAYQIAKAWVEKAKTIAASQGLRYQGLDYQAGIDPDGKWGYALLR